MKIAFSPFAFRSVRARFLEGVSDSAWTHVAIKFLLISRMRTGDRFMKPLVIKAMEDDLR